MKKRLIAVLMCAAMVTVLGAGCGSKKEDTNIGVQGVQTR